MIPIGDINKDGWDDFVGAVTDAGTNSTAHIYFGEENGPSSSAPDLSLNVPEPLLAEWKESNEGLTTFASADVNGDGWKDLIIGIASPRAGISSANVLLGRPVWPKTLNITLDADGKNDADIRFAAPTLNGSSLTFSTAKDLTGDGNDEILVSDALAKKVYIVSGNTKWKTVKTHLNADFSDSQENLPSDDGFTTLQSSENLWHKTSRRSNDAGHSSPHSYYFGLEANGNYDTNTRVKGELISPEIDLTAVSDVTPITVTWKSFLQTENISGFDVAKVETRIKPTGGVWGTWEQKLICANSTTWVTNTSIDVSNARGATLQIRFSFDSVDGWANNYEGWYIDDVVIKSGRVDLTASSASVFAVGTVSPVNGFGKSSVGVENVTGSTANDLAILSDTGLYIIPGPITASINNLPVTPTKSRTSPATRIYSAGDLTGDGKNDILLSGQQSAIIAGSSLDLSDGLPGYLQPLGDIDGDNKLDLGSWAVETTSDSFGWPLYHFVGQVYLGQLPLALNSPSIVIETGVPYY